MKKVDKRLKTFLSILLVLAVAVFIARVFWPKPPARIQSSVKTALQKKKKPPIAIKKTQVPAKVVPRMAIILDDWGMSVSLVDDAVAVGRPLTLSVLPHLAHSRDVAEAAHAQKLGVMLHMPMQAKSLKAPREPRTIRVASSDEEILDYLDQALANVPYVEGVNNHQGSAATSDARVMHTVLRHLKRKDLFFVDSRVIATSICAKEAEDVGIEFTTRDVFIDNVATVPAIKKQLREAIRLALKRGTAVAIGHDKKVTIEVIQQMVPEIEKSGVKIVFVKELLQ